MGKERQDSEEKNWQRAPAKNDQNKARTSLSMTQQYLADAPGLDRTYISLVKHGE